MRRVGLWLVVALIAGVGGCVKGLTPAQQLADEAAVKMSQGNLTDAEKVLRQSLAKDPNLAWAHFNLASCLRARGAFDEAVAEYRLAARHFRKRRAARSAALYGVATSLDGKNSFQEAIGAYEEYVQFVGQDANHAESSAMAKARMEFLRDAIAQGLPSGKPIRAALKVTTPPEETTPPPDASPVTPPEETTPAPVTPPPATKAPAPAKKPAKGRGQPKGLSGAKAPAPAKKPAKGRGQPKGLGGAKAPAPAKKPAKGRGQPKGLGGDAKAPAGTAEKKPAP